MPGLRASKYSSAPEVYDWMLHYARQHQHEDPSLLEAVNAKEKADFKAPGEYMIYLHKREPGPTTDMMWEFSGMAGPAWRILVQAWNEGVCTMPCS